MFFNDGVVSDDICLHLSVEKVYVTELSASLVLFQVILLHNEVTMLLMSFIQWCSLLILLESPYLLRADDKNRTRFNIKRKLEDNYVELQNIYTSVEEFTSLYAPDDKRLEGLEVMTDYLMVECGETFIQMDDGKACLDAIISVVQHMPDFDVNNLSCGDDHQNCSWFHGNETKEKIETFRYALLNGVGRCNYSITTGERQSFKVSCVRKQNTQVSTERHEVSVNDGNTEDCPPDALFWQGLEDWSSNLTSMLRRLKAETHDELEQTCRDHITLFRERKKRKREQSKERKKRKRQQRRERKKSKRERQRQKRRKMKERKKKQKEKEKRKEERQVKKAAKEEKRQHRQSKGKQRQQR